MKKIMIIKSISRFLCLLTIILHSLHSFSMQQEQEPSLQLTCQLPPDTPDYMGQFAQDIGEIGKKINHNDILKDQLDKAFAPVFNRLDKLGKQCESEEAKAAYQQTLKKAEEQKREIQQIFSNTFLLNLLEKLAQKHFGLSSQKLQ